MLKNTQSSAIFIASLFLKNFFAGSERTAQGRSSSTCRWRLKSPHSPGFSVRRYICGVYYAILGVGTVPPYPGQIEYRPTYCTTLTFIQCCGSGAFLTLDPDPGSGLGFFPDPGSQSHIFYIELSDKFLGKKFYNCLKTGPNFFLQRLIN
jgi:hypothetical protein